MVKALLIRPTLQRVDLGVTSFEGDNLVVLYYLIASEIWTNRREDIWWEEVL
jgi:hypothetical protein